mgnify:FL=1
MLVSLCEYCNQEIRYRKNGKRVRRFCDSACYGNWMREHERGQTAHNWKGANKERVCPVCDGVFYSRDAEKKKYCSVKCYATHKSTEMSHPDYVHYTKHGMAETRTYKIWAGMKNRATNTKGRDARNYVGRGISICDRWLFFENFYEDMGEAPEGMSLDRIDVNGKYNPSNCRWATPQEQANNTRMNIIISYRGTTDTLANWSRKLDIKYGTLLSRYRRKWSIEKILTTSVQFKNKEAA